MHRLQDMRGGRDNDPRFGSRMKGEGLWAQLIRMRFDQAARRLGMSRQPLALDASRFDPSPLRRPPESAPAAQAELF